MLWLPAILVAIWVLERISAENATKPEGHIKAVFRHALFATMGYVAKADGRVSVGEVRFVTQLMDEMELNSEQRKLAQNLFREGKTPDFRLDDALQRLSLTCPPEMLQVFVLFLMWLVYADGLGSNIKRRVVWDIASEVGVSREQLDEIEAVIRSKTEGASSSSSEGASSSSSLEDAYKVLKVSPGASDAEIKRAYRNRVKDFHPDGLPPELSEEILRFAEERMKEITLAYERIRQARNL